MIQWAFLVAQTVKKIQLQCIIQVNHKSNDPSILIRKTQGKFERWTSRSSVKMKAEIGVMWPQPRMPAATRSQKRQGKNLLPNLYREHSPTNTSDPQCLASSIVRQYTSVVLSHQVCDSVYSSFRKLI